MFSANLLFHLRHPKLKAPTNTVYLLSLAEPKSFQTTPIKRTSTVKGGLNNKVFIIIRYLSSHKPEQHEASNYLGWVTWRLEKCYKYHMRVKPTMSMKKVNPFCYQNLRSSWLKMGHAHTSASQRGANEDPHLIQVSIYLFMATWLVGFYFLNKQLNPGPQKEHRVLTTGPPGNSGTRVSYNSLQGLESEYKALPPLRILG